MEQIVISLLFLYPGALVDVISKALFRYSYCEDDTSETAHIARYFVSSALITIASIMMYARLGGGSVATLTDIVSALTGIIELLKYVGISLCCTVVFALVWHFAGWAVRSILNIARRKLKGYINVCAVDAWHEIAMGKGTKDIRRHAIIRIHTGEQSRVGFIKYWPEKLHDGIMLTQCKIVEEYFEYDAALENDKDKYIGDPWCTMYDPESGSYIEVYEGDKLYRYLGFPD